MISDKDILINLKALEDKVIDISIKAKENVPLTTSESETVNILPSISIKWINTNFLLNLLYILIPIFIFSVLYYFKPNFVMEEIKIDTFLTKMEISYLKLSAFTVVISFIIFFIFFIAKYKEN